MVVAALWVLFSNRKSKSENSEIKQPRFQIYTLLLLTESIRDGFLQLYIVLLYPIQTIKNKYNLLLIVFQIFKEKSS